MPSDTSSSTAMLSLAFFAKTIAIASCLVFLSVFSVLGVGPVAAHCLYAMSTNLTYFFMYAYFYRPKVSPFEPYTLGHYTVCIFNVLVYVVMNSIASLSYDQNEPGVQPVVLIGTSATLIIVGFVWPLCMFNIHRDQNHSLYAVLLVMLVACYFTISSKTHTCLNFEP